MEGIGAMNTTKRLSTLAELEDIGWKGTPVSMDTTRAELLLVRKGALLPGGRWSRRVDLRDIRSLLLAAR